MKENSLEVDRRPERFPMINNSMDEALQTRYIYFMRMVWIFKAVLAISVFLLFGLDLAIAQTNVYSWISRVDSSMALASRIIPPEGYSRVETQPGTFEEWLRHLPLKDGKPAVMLYNGEMKGNQSAHFAVLDIDVGDENLQQCADAVIRLRAEYLYSIHSFELIRFNFTNGDTASWRKWIFGYRPVINGNKSRWVKSGLADSSYANFRNYLDCVFNYAGTLSLSKETVKIDNPGQIRIGDIFIRGGKPGTMNPGHAVIVLDMAKNAKTGDIVFLLAQSYMPAQDIHILNNPDHFELNPWYKLNISSALRTPEWTFKMGELNRFR
jgi:hypothetical protein